MQLKWETFSDQFHFDRSYRETNKHEKVTEHLNNITGKDLFLCRVSCLGSMSLVNGIRDSFPVIEVNPGSWSYVSVWGVIDHNYLMGWL